MSQELFVQSLISGLTQGSVYALIGLGFTVIYSVTAIINFAQGEFVVLGGILLYVLATSLGMPLVPAVVISIAAAALVGGMLYSLAIRPARGGSVVSLIIITIGAAILIRGIAGWRWGAYPVAPPFFSGDDSISFLGASIHPQALWIVGSTVLVAVVLHLFLSYTMLGKALRACAANRLGAGLVGINPKSMALVSFCLAGALGALGGVVLSPLSTMTYDRGAMLGLKGFVASSVGGFRSIMATVAGGIMLGVIENLTVAVNWGPFTSQYKEAIALTILLLILLIRSGKLSEQERAA